MPFNDKQLAALSAPLDKKHVRDREQSGRKLSYIEGWWAESEANRIFGFDGWDSTTLDIRLVAEKPRKIKDSDGWGVSYVATVRVRVLLGDNEVVMRDGVGAGHGIDRDLGLAHESAIKEAVTDAEKRALKTFGNPFGLALYDKTQANVVSGVPAESRDLSPHPEGKDWWGCEGSGPSAHQAKKDGLDLMHENFRTEIASLSSATGWREWCGDRTDDIKRMPKSWRVILRAEAEERAGELGVDFNSKRAA